MTYLSNSSTDTIDFAARLSRKLKGGEVVLLHGELGAGKTHFVKGIALGLGIKDEVTSPTFALHNRYCGSLILNHFDFYRLDSGEEALQLGLVEFFHEKNAVCFIEWAENVEEIIPKDALKVFIVITGDDARKIEVDDELSFA